MNHPQLGPAMRNLAERVAMIEPPEGLEATVMAEFDRAHRRRPARMFAMCGALAASLVAGTLLLRPTPPEPAAAAESPVFYPIPYTSPLEPYERVMIVQKQVSVSELIAAGFHIPAADSDGAMQAEVMVSQDGRARAIRPVSFQVSERSIR
jgi:hypothetical protein